MSLPIPMIRQLRIWSSAPQQIQPMSPVCNWCHPKHVLAADGSESTGICPRHLAQMRRELEWRKRMQYLASMFKIFPVRFTAKSAGGIFLFFSRLFHRVRVCGIAIKPTPAPGSCLQVKP